MLRCAAVPSRVRVRAHRRAVSAVAAAYPPPSAPPAAVKDRAKAALLGALLADAATMPLHWHYDVAQIKRKVLRQDDGPLQAMAGMLFADNSPLDLAALAPEFYNPPGNMFYTLPLGALSPYGEEAAALVRSVAKEGALVPQAFADDSAASFRAYGGRLNSLSKRFLENVDAGKRFPSCGVVGDTQAHSLVRVPTVVARLAGSAACRDAVSDAVRVHQADQAPVDYAQAFAAILERVVLGSSVADALKWAAFSKENPLYTEQRTEAANALAELDTDPRKIVSKYGISCSLPGPFVGPLALVFAAGGDFKAAVRANLMAGGDNCSRAAVVGSLCGASGGMASLPPDWTAKVTGWAALEAAADKIVTDAGYV